mmetsp:Transcript_3204/g.8874  ORF Transcript_3204/g.8874 Transcript_3204/m.8874 type:complete len:225 (+) Transcript_3204:301-975(+)
MRSGPARSSRILCGLVPQGLLELRLHARALVPGSLALGLLLLLPLGAAGPALLPALVLGVPVRVAAPPGVLLLHLLPAPLVEVVDAPALGIRRLLGRRASGATGRRGVRGGAVPLLRCSVADGGSLLQRCLVGPLELAELLDSAARVGMGLPDLVPEGLLDLLARAPGADAQQRPVARGRPQRRQGPPAGLVLPAAPGRLSSAGWRGRGHALPACKFAAIGEEG